MKKQKLQVILGPTAAGKTSYAIDLARKQGGSIVSADSRQVYAGMNIGTAKPREAWSDDSHDHMTPDVVRGVDHYLLNISSPDQRITLVEWQRQAFEITKSIVDSGGVPLLVGGTMLYIDSVVLNYDIPEVGPHQLLRNDLESWSTEDLYAQLLAKDSAAQEFIEPHHRRRLIRALEVIETTGKPFSDQRRKRKPRYDVELIGLFPTGEDLGNEKGWKELERRILRRSQEMFDAGLVDEVQRLHDRYGDTAILQTMGYKQAFEVLHNEKSQNSAVKLFCQAQMKYARRQMSWWRRNEEIRWFK